MNNEDQTKQLAEELKKRSEYFNQLATKEDESLKATHTKKEYTFSTVEKRRLLQQESIIAFAQQAVDDIINLSALARLDITPTKEFRVIYDSSLGKFIVWEPKSK